MFGREAGKGKAAVEVPSGEAKAMGTVRSFVALELSPAAKASVTSVLQRLSARYPQFRWVAPTTLHLTLKFLGDVETGRLAQLEMSLERAVARWRKAMPQTGEQPAPAVRWALKGAGSFPRGRPARVIWVGIEAGPDLHALQSAVEKELAAEFFSPEARPFSPHLTLARCRGESGQPAPWLSDLAGQSLGETESAEMVLFRSTLTPTGAIYAPLKRVPL